ncbi:MAG: ribosome small subunit-dependent GTPase A [Crocinitomicaceae bacterium TMED135]|nr:MAG: ribosome small subunit-dependent GTPase A [Crocinitomicaceae bacterium TMED135]
MQKGTVYRSTGSWYDVKLEDGEFTKARIQGKFRNLSIRTTNPVSVGDKVDVSINDNNEAVIKNIYPRKNYIIRKSVNLSKEAHIIASNIDLAILLVTVVSPLTSPGFIDRFTVTAEAYNIPLLIVFNKVEIYDSKALAKLEDLEISYSKAGYPTLRMSVLENIGTEDLKKKIQDKSVLVSGNSGAGKSTLINNLIPDLRLKVGKISETHNKGKHTTTFAEMFDYNSQTKIIDTPGIKGFGLVDFEKEELATFFPEMLSILKHCKFHNCKHINEPGCEVLEQLKSHNFSNTRYQSYLAMYKEDVDTNYRKNNY